MNADEIITRLGGVREVLTITKLSKGRIAQWSSENKIPRAWLIAFHYMKPELIPHPDQKNDQQKYEFKDLFYPANFALTYRFILTPCSAAAIAKLR